MHDLARYIDHTCLKPDATPNEIVRLCHEARQYHFLTVCVNPIFVELATSVLAGSETKPIAVVGFPLGAARCPVKAYEAETAIRDGAREIDMVIWVGGLKGRRYEEVENNIRAVVNASGNIPVKVIIETDLLTHDDKIIACQISQQAGAQFVKTCTGFSTGAATVEDIQLIRKIVGPQMGIKASGGIRDAKTATALLEAGATRLGTSSSVAIVTGAQATGSY